jgi:glutamyl-tRNA synthetase
MLSSKLRVRFAPSPTGYLHIGGARTALFNWLLARKHGGTFILRIEDTDEARSTEAALNAILDGLRWLGLDWDEGPFFQSQRTDLYRAALEQLEASGGAYRSHRTAEELERYRADAIAAGRMTVIDRDWLMGGDRSAPSVVRLKAPRGGTTVLDDLVKGPVEKSNDELDDLVLMRSDGTFTYNFVVVVDDVEMAISHVLRGDDHLANTFRQLAIYDALGRAAPRFGHVPLILGQDRQRLSKRHGATDLMSYRDAGYLPEAMVNFLARIGWSHGDDEIFTREELVQKFSIEGVGRSAGVWNPEKLLWVNQHWIKASSANRLAQLVGPMLAARGIPDAAADGRLGAILGTLQERSRTLVEMAEAAHFFWRGPDSPADLDAEAVKKWMTPAGCEALRDVRARLADLPDDGFEVAAVEAAVRAIAEARGMGLGKVCQPIRVAVSGTAVSPPIFDVVHLLGRGESLARIDRALAWITS